MRANLQTILSDGETGTLLDGNIWGGRRAPQECEGKECYATWFNRFSNFNNQVENGTPCSVSRTFEIRVWCRSYSFLREAESAITADIESFGYVTNVQDGYDNEVNLYFMAVDVSIFDDIGN